MDDETMSAFRDRVTRYSNRDFDETFQGIKDDFVKASPEQRAAWLAGWDNSLALETRVSKDFAEFVSKKRELNDLHRLLQRCGR